jgi:small conductance mechanosensitive channel
MIQDRAMSVGWQILGALVLYIVGRWMISLVVSAVQRGLARHKIDDTVFRFIGNALSVALNITLVVAILGYFGVQTNFAAGAFLVVLRPFKVGDFIAAGGGHRHSTRNRHVCHDLRYARQRANLRGQQQDLLGHDSKLYGESISSRGFDRSDLWGSHDFRLAIQRLKDRIATIPNVCKTPATDVTILSFTPFGPVLAVRPYCHNDNYWQVYFDCNAVIREVLGDQAFPGATYPLTVSEVKKASATA